MTVLFSHSNFIFSWSSEKDRETDSCTIWNDWYHYWTLMSKLVDLIVPSSFRTTLEKLERERTASRRGTKVSCHCILILWNSSKLLKKKKAEEKFLETGILLDKTSSWTDIERMSHLMIKTLPPVQFDKNQMYNVKNFITREEYLNAVLIKLNHQQDGLKWPLTLTYVPYETS